MNKESNNELTKDLELQPTPGKCSECGNNTWYIINIGKYLNTIKCSKCQESGCKLPLHKAFADLVWGLVDTPLPIQGLADGSYRYVFEKNRPATIQLPATGLTMNIMQHDDKWYGVTTTRIPKS